MYLKCTIQVSSGNRIYPCNTHFKSRYRTFPLTQKVPSGPSVVKSSALPEVTVLISITEY